ncbi:hypothetical protein K435DRAFT_695031, partial [Dendrothele bispora CBS 962.96]
DLVLSQLSPIDRHRYSLVSREALATVRSFNNRAFRVSKLLNDYFPDVRHLTRFRHLQRQLGVLISGSTALQFFNLVTYQDSDLDLYVNVEHAKPLILFLSEIGYVFAPRSPGQHEFQRRLSDDNLGVLRRRYEGRGIMIVFDYLKNGKKIQVIVTKQGPVDCILGFHSTCVINFISHSHTYSLFPYTTFESRATVRLSRALHPHDRDDDNFEAAIRKYRERGWMDANLPSAAVYLSSRSEFYDGERSVGDAATWKIQLEAIGDDAVPFHFVTSAVEPVGCNSWYQKIQGTNFVIEHDNMGVGIFHQPCTVKHLWALIPHVRSLSRDDPANEYL